MTPQSVELISSAQEHVSIVRWRVAAPPPVEETRFELWGPNGYQPIDFDKSVFPGGITACADGSGACAQYVTRDDIEPPARTRLVRAVHAKLGVLPGAEVKRRWLSETFKLESSAFSARNDAVIVSITDEIATDGPYLYPRTYERAMWPTGGLCVSDSAPDGVSFSTLNVATGFPPEQPLTDSGTYCVASRPIANDGGDVAMDQVRIETRPEVQTSVATFQPPVETSPILYQIVLDLHIPVDDICAETIAGIERTVEKYLSAPGTPVRKLQTINLSANGGCYQDNARTLPYAGMAQDIVQAVTSYPQVHQQFHLLYFNNLEELLPPMLQNSFNLLLGSVAAPPGYDLTVISWLFNPGTAMLSQIPWTKFTPFLAYDDPSVVQDLVVYSGKLPYRTQVHDYQQPVPLLSQSDAAGHVGQLIKVCTATPPVVPVTTIPTVQPVAGPSWTISADDPPAYRVSLPDQIAVPQTSFVQATSVVRYQICTRYCVDHPFIATSGSGEPSWSTSLYCASEDN